MAILIDPPAWPAHGMLWCHLVSDENYDELHEFAARLGIPRRAFDLDHYDIPESRYADAVALGAGAVGQKELVRRMCVSGMRVRRGDRAAVTALRRDEYLTSSWRRLAEQFGLGSRGLARWADLGDELQERWREPHRSYHNEVHLEDVLLALNQLEIRGERVAPTTLAAAWFHDAVYRGEASDEAESAELAHDALGAVGIRAEDVQAVSALILATNPRELHSSRAGEGFAQLLDSDVAIFAAPTHRYDAYRDAVRQEYAHIADADFIVGRGEILRTYLAREPLYFTQAARTLWESRARQNLARELGLLAATD